jgi:hypothetical protein
MAAMVEPKEQSSCLKCMAANLSLHCVRTSAQQLRQIMSGCVHPPGPLLDLQCQDRRGKLPLAVFPSPNTHTYTRARPRFLHVAPTGSTLGEAWGLPISCVPSVTSFPLHRQPENWLLTTEDDSAVLKAADFGLSTYFQPGQTFNSIVGR